MRRREALCLGALTIGVVTLVSGMPSSAQPPQPQPAPTQPRKTAPTATGQMTDEQARQLAGEAYLYGYPLVTMELTRRHITNVAKAGEMQAPMGQFANMKSYPTAEFKEVTAPNADTLYSSAFLDVTNEAYVLEVPDMGKRFYMMPMLDGFTNVFADPGTRTTGNKAQKFLIVGPSFQGTVPEGMKELKSPTGIAWIIGRTYSSGTKQDIAAVNALQAKYKLTPLSAYAPGKRYTPPAGKVDPSIDMKTPPRDQVNALSGTEYFTLLAQLLKDNPPAPEDAPMVAKLAKLGIVPGQDFNASKLDRKLAAAIDQIPKVAQAAIRKTEDSAGTRENGWIVTKTGRYGTNYMFRAVIAYFGLGANLPEDAIYPVAKADQDGQPFDASKNNYTLTFASKKELPPVKGFWSLTMYDDEYFFVKNPKNRYTVSQRDKLKTNKDGSITVYLQKDSPGPGKEANWLPAPDGKFVLMMRLYWPNEKPPTILDGSWKPPAVERAPEAAAQTR